ncbi:hypothetical protein F4780DRAFT_633945 [Xylariomycetidae sp. FL0641]|nr:hypothetical protein F4780DRAFT_633945 [Xylariomycetidae sp. FL0641]
MFRNVSTSLLALSHRTLIRCSVQWGLWREFMVSLLDHRIGSIKLQYTKSRPPQSPGFQGPPLQAKCIGDRENSVVATKSLRYGLHPGRCRIPVSLPSSLEGPTVGSGKAGEGYTYEPWAFTSSRLLGLWRTWIVVDVVVGLSLGLLLPHAALVMGMQSAVSIHRTTPGDHSSRTTAKSTELVCVPGLRLLLTECTSSAIEFAIRQPLIPRPTFFARQLPRVSPQGRQPITKVKRSFAAAGLWVCCGIVGHQHCRRSVTEQ